MAKLDINSNDGIDHGLITPDDNLNDFKKIFLDEENPNTNEVIEDLYSKARNQTPETFPEFMKTLIERYAYDYGTITHALAIAAIGAASAMDSSDVGGITGFQASFVTWNFVRYWLFKNNKCGLRLMDYDDMLYPQYRYKFDRVIDQSTWDHIQDEARKAIEQDDALSDVGGVRAHPDVRQHWENIVNGKVPFGFHVKGE